MKMGAVRFPDVVASPRTAKHFLANIDEAIIAADMCHYLTPAFPLWLLQTSQTMCESVFVKSSSHVLPNNPWYASCIYLGFIEAEDLFMFFFVRGNVMRAPLLPSNNVDLLVQQ